MSRFLVVFALALGLAFGSGRDVRSASPQQIPLVMTGAWVGTANLTVDWIEQPTIAMTLFLNPEGRVSGTIGDATIRNARFERNRGAFARFFTPKSAWLVTGQLQGSLIRAEGLQRLQFSMPLNWVRDPFEGRFTAWNPTVRDRGDRPVSANYLRLDRLW